MTDDQHRCRPVPPSIDTTRPSIARTYDAALGGKDNFEVDRAVMRQVLEAMPDFGQMATDNRNWLIRVVRFIVRETGVDQFLDVGSGLPTAENTHQAAQRLDPGVRVAYVDNDPACQEFGRAFLEENAHTRFVEADLTKPHDLLARPEVDRFLDLDRPVALIQCSTFHHIADEKAPRKLAEAYRTALAPGSYLALSHGFDPDDSGYYTTLARGVEEAFRDSGFGDVHYRTRPEIQSYFGDWEMIEPGLVPLRDWWPDGPHIRAKSDADKLMVGAVARKP